MITPLALTETILTDGEKDFGTIVIDMGGGQTTTSVIRQTIEILMLTKKAASSSRKISQSY